MRFTILLLCSFLFSTQGIAQNNPTQSPIVFIYDASGSMWGQLQGKTKKEIASNVLTNTVNKLPNNQKVGLVAYGHRKKGDCEDVEFLVDIASGSKVDVTSAIKKINPLGRTPLAYSATLVIDQLRTSKMKATVILVTDGIESCDGNICDVVKAAKAEGIDFRLHIIGFGLKAGETEQLKCAAIAGEGRYYNASDAEGLGEVLEEATSKTIDKPKGNVSVYATKNGIAIDAWVKAYDVVSKRAPISVRTYQDTAYFYLPPSKYNLEANPLEGSDVKKLTITGIQSFDDKIVHQDISFDGGKIEITTTNNESNWDCMVKIINRDGNVIAALRTYDTPKEVEVNPGTYDIAIQALNSMKGVETTAELKDVRVLADDTTPVFFNFESGTLFIDAIIDDESIDSVVSINEATTDKNVAGGRTYNRGKEFLLNPGTYSVIVRPLGKFKDRKAQTFTVEINKGAAISKAIKF